MGRTSDPHLLALLCPVSLISTLNRDPYQGCSSATAAEGVYELCHVLLFPQFLWNVEQQGEWRTGLISSKLGPRKAALGSCLSAAPP
jgi:hypothetical protein